MVHRVCSPAPSFHYESFVVIYTSSFYITGTTCTVVVYEGSGVNATSTDNIVWFRPMALHAGLSLVAAFLSSQARSATEMMRHLLLILSNVDQ